MVTDMSLTNLTLTVGYEHCFVSKLKNEFFLCQFHDIIKIGLASENHGYIITDKHCDKQPACFIP